MARNSTQEQEKRLKSLSPLELYELKVARWKARTDLGWLCREILDYPDISDVNGGAAHAIHQPIIDILQKFPIPTTQQQFEEHDKLLGSTWHYKPLKPMLQLEGKRRALILDPRGHLKTSLNSQAHTIQWILNYPDIAILIFQAADQKAADILFEIKSKFQYNDKFRTLFPEHCPQKSIGDWGRADRFTTEARSKSKYRREPTVMTGAIEKGAAGYHVEVMKCADIVDENNIVGNGLETVRKKFFISENLLVSPSYWIDVEGTRYHFGDLYGKIIENELEKPIEKREYKVHMRSVFRREGEESYPTMTLEEKVAFMRAPFKTDENERRIPLWPERFTLEKLDDMEQRDNVIFASQQMNWPISSVGGLTPFPTEGGYPKIISRKNFKDNIRVAYKQITIDTAETTNKRSNYTAIVLSTVAHDGRRYVEKIVHGKFLPNEIVNQTLLLAVETMMKSTQLQCIKIEETSFVRGLMPSFEAAMATAKLPPGIILPPIEPIKRGSRVSKEERIKSALQPPYIEGKLIFVEDLGYPESKDAATTIRLWGHLKKELEQFPNGETDDLLDAIADIYTSEENFGRYVTRQNFKQSQSQAFDKWLDIEPWNPTAYDEDGAAKPSVKQDPWYDKVGY